MHGYRHRRMSASVSSARNVCARSERQLSALHVEICIVQQSDRSLPHHCHSRPIADIDRGSRRCAAAFALLPFVYGAAYFLLESSVSGRGRPIPPNNH
jgi:hypothetical protein